MSTCVRIVADGKDHILRGVDDSGDILFSCPFQAGKEGYATYDEAKEGDMKSPIGVYSLLPGYIRADRIIAPDGLSLPLRSTQPEDGWCDDADHPAYNCPVTRPFNASHECMFREDASYDIVIPLSFNTDPVVTGKGSAIFFHVIRSDAIGTAGCIAIATEDMLRLLPLLSRQTRFSIES